MLTASGSSMARTGRSGLYCANGTFASRGSGPSLAAGAIFGAVMGTLYVNIGATIGATLAFLVARYLFHDMIQNKFGPRLEKINRELETRGFNYLLFLRLGPPFPRINLGAGLTRVPLRTFFLEP